LASGVSSKRHAQAVFQIALENNELEGWRSALHIMGERLKDPQLVGLLENPKVSFSQKQQILRTVLEGVGPLTMNLAYLLVAKNRLGVLGDLIAEYGYLMDAHQGREHALVTTAVSLEEGEKHAVEVKLAEAIKKEVVVATRVDPAIVGGMIVRIGDQLIDGSVRARLGGLKKNLIEAEIPS
jgi:F-type H+-transporting ATPase subunit delta